MIDVAGRRAFVDFAQARKMSVSRSCELVKVSRRRLGYVSRKNEDGDGGELAARLKELAMQHPRYGGRRLWALLWLPAQLRRAWEQRFPVLAEISRITATA